MCESPLRDAAPRPPDHMTLANVRSWLGAMARWEARQPQNIRARRKRDQWLKIHDFADRRWRAARTDCARSFWARAMLRAMAKALAHREHVLWRRELKMWTKT